MNAPILLLAAISIFRMGGDIHVDDAPSGALLRTMGGDIRVTRGAGRIVAKTMGGNIDIRQLEGSADVGSMGGDIRVNVVGSGAGHDLDVHTLGGCIEVTLPRDFDGDFSVELKRITTATRIESPAIFRWRSAGRPAGAFLAARAKCGPPPAATAMRRTASASAPSAAT